MYLLRSFLCILSVFFTGSVFAQNSLLDTLYKPPSLKGSVRFFLEDISRQTGIEISYSDDLIKQKSKVRLKGTEQTVGEVLLSVLAGSAAKPLVRNGKILLVPAEKELSQKKLVTISGYVKDSSSKEVLIGAVVYVPELNLGTVTNSYGFYNLTLPPGNHRIVTASLAYKADTMRRDVQTNLRHDVLLSYGLALGTVTISSQTEKPSDHVHLNMQDLEGHAGMLGENDVLRALQHIPGVQSGTEGTSSALVRGGDPGQNLNLLDGVPLYYIDHFYGLTSVFNTESVKSVGFYKGAFPARFGGRLSSIIDVNSRDGNMERVGGQASIGLLKGSVALEGPIVKDKASVMIAGRRTWIDALWRPYTNEVGIDFYDVNAKANYIINKNNRAYISFYTGRDQFRMEFGDSKTRALWGNTLGSARWTTIVHPKLFINTTATYSYFRYAITDRSIAATPDSAGRLPDYNGLSTIADASLRVQADYYLTSNQRVQGGVYFANARFNPATTTFAENIQGFNNTVSATGFTSQELIAYLEDDWKPSPKWHIRAGVHWANWFSNDYHYQSFQPRLFVSWQPKQGHSIFLSVCRMSQFLHLLTSNTSSLPADFWVPSTKALKPAHSWLYSVGTQKKVSPWLSLSAEVYYKDLRNVVGYRGASNIFQNSLRWEESLVQGRGESYGLELLAEATKGWFATTVCYTLSRTTRTFEHLNNGDPFPFRYDRRHNLKLDVVFQKGKRFSAVAGWTYMSGEAVTLPEQVYPGFDNNILGSISSNPFVYGYGKPNNYRLPAIHRLDLALRFIRKRGDHFVRTWTIGVYNAYGRNNIVGVTLLEESPGQYELQGISLFRFIPTISYAVKF